MTMTRCVQGFAQSLAYVSVPFEINDRSALLKRAPEFGGRLGCGRKSWFVPIAATFRPTCQGKAMTRYGDGNRVVAQNAINLYRTIARRDLFSVGDVIRELESDRVSRTPIRARKSSD